MNLIKLLAVGAAAAYGVNELTKKRADGRSMVDNIKERAPEWMEKARPYIDQVKNRFNRESHNMQSGSTY